MVILQYNNSILVNDGSTSHRFINNKIWQSQLIYEKSVEVLEGRKYISYNNSDILTFSWDNINQLSIEKETEKENNTALR